MTTARCVAGDAPVASSRLPLIALRWLLLATIVSVTAAACYSGGGGTSPPPDQLYYPVGLVVSNGGNVLYAVNSDFDLQWNGGTLQSYDLFLLRHDADALINANVLAPQNGIATNLACSGDTTAGCLPFLSDWAPYGSAGSCLNATPASDDDESANESISGTRVPLGESCAPAVDSQHYVQDNVTIGAFATGLKLSPDGSRLFMPVRGNASLTWVDVQPDDPTTVPLADDLPGVAAPGSVAWSQNVVQNDPSSDPFTLECFADSGGQCTTTAGNFVDPLDSRQLTLPGEPFALALTPDGTAVAITHQTSQNTSLLLTACDPSTESPGCSIVGGTNPCSTSPFPSNLCHVAPISGAISPYAPSMQFVLSGVANGGDGIAAVPHDDSPNAPAIGCEYTLPTPYTQPCVRPAFLETNHTSAVVDLLRYVNDDGSSVTRPYLFTDTVYTLTSNETGVDERGIAIDPTPRMACRSRAAAANGGVLSAYDDGQCGLVPSRVFIASRSPASLILGQIGGLSLSGDGSFNPDLLSITGNQPLPLGASNVYLAPIVNEAGDYELRVFVVLFDSNEIAVYNPGSGAVETIIPVGQGPFAMAFDPFDLSDVAKNAPVPQDTRQVDGVAAPPNTALTGPTLKRYRFAYVANFTFSFVQVIDLDNSMPAISPLTFEHVVFTLGQPTAPKGQ